MIHLPARYLLFAFLLVLPFAMAQAQEDTTYAEPSADTPGSAVTDPDAPTLQTLGEILQAAVAASDDLSIISARIRQAEHGLDEARANYYPQVTLTERFGRDISNPSSIRQESDPRGTSEYVNANTTKMEINQMLFDGFKTPAEIARQRQLMEGLLQRHRTTSQQVVNDTVEVYLTAWRHLQALRAGIAMVEDMSTLKRKIDLQAEAGATDQTVQSYVDSRLTGATQELLKTRNAYREALFRLGYLLQQQVTPESFGFPPLLAPALQEIDAYIATARTDSPQLLEQLANKKAAKQELRREKSGDYPTLSLTSDVQDSNDLGGSVGNQRSANAMVQVSYKLFDGFATRSKKARVKSQITEAEYRLRRTSRQLEEDLSQAWRKAIAARQEAKLATDEANASLKVKTLRAQDVESGQGDIVRLIEAEEALYTTILRQLDLVQTVTQKRYELSIASGQLKNLLCVDGGCPELPMEPVTYVNPADATAEKPVTDVISTTTIVSSTENLLPVSTTVPQEPVATEPLTPPDAIPAADPSATFPATPSPTLPDLSTTRASPPQVTTDPDAPRDFEAPDSPAFNPHLEPAAGPAISMAETPGKPFTNPLSMPLSLPESQPHALEINDMSELQETRYHQKDSPSAPAPDALPMPMDSPTTIEILQPLVSPPARPTS